MPLMKTQSFEAIEKNRIRRSLLEPVNAMAAAEEASHPSNRVPINSLKFIRVDLKHLNRGVECFPQISIESPQSELLAK